jgi:hypothetical protein
MVHGVFLNLIQPTICIASWKVFFQVRSPILVMRHSSANISLRVSLFLFESSFAAARISLS